MNNFLVNRAREKSSLLGLVIAAIGSALPAIVPADDLSTWMQLVNGLIGVVLILLPDRKALPPVAVIDAIPDPRVAAAVREAQGNTVIRSPVWIGIAAILLTIAACAPTEDHAARLARAQAALACAAEIGREVQVTAQADGDNVDKALASAEAATLVAAASSACQALAAP